MTFVGAFLEHLLEDLQPRGIVIDDEHTQAGGEPVVPRGREAGLHRRVDLKTGTHMRNWPLGCFNYGWMEAREWGRGVSSEGSPSSWF